jgi:hypothetical protein
MCFLRDAVRPPPLMARDGEQHPGIGGRFFFVREKPRYDRMVLVRYLLRATS